MGLLVSLLAELSTYAHIRLADMGIRAKRGAGKRGGVQSVDARMAIVWPAGSTHLDLLTKCLIAFQDPVYKLDEIGILIFAAMNV